MEHATATTDSGKPLPIEEWPAWKKFGEASSSHDGDGKRHGKASLEKKKKKNINPNACRH